MKHSLQIFILIFSLGLWIPPVFAGEPEVRIAWDFPKPSSKVPESLNLLVNGKSYPVIEKGVSVYQALQKSELAGYGIPANALLAAYSWHAGYGDVVYVMSGKDTLKIYRREMDESETSRFPAKNIATITLK